MTAKISVFTTALASPFCGCSNPPGGECQVTAPDSAGQGSSFDVLLSLSNDGDVDLTGVRIQVWVDGSPITTLFPGSLMPGGSMQLNPVTINLPANFPTGWHNTTAHITCDQIGGSAVCKVSFQVVGTAPPPPPPPPPTNQPKATIYTTALASPFCGCSNPPGGECQVTAPDKPTPGASFDELISVANEGNITLTNVRVNLWRDGVSLRTVPVGTLAPGQGVDLPPQTITLPANLSLGTHNITAHLLCDQVGGSAVCKVNFQVAAPANVELVPHLMAAGVSCPDNSEVLQDQPFDYWYSTTNNGTTPAHSLTLFVYYAGVLIKTTPVGTLAAGASSTSYKGTTTARASGVLTVIAQATEDAAQCSIGLTVQQPQTNLKCCLTAKGVTGCTDTGPASITAVPGESLGAEALLINTGTITAYGAQLYGNGTLLWEGDLPASQQIMRGFTVMAPQSNFTITAQAPAQNAATATAQINVAVQAVNPPLLVPVLEALGVTCPQNGLAQAGSPFTFWFRVRNDGQGDAHDVGLWVYYGDQLVQAEGVGLLPAGATSANFQGQISVDAPALLSLVAGSQEGTQQCSIGVEVTVPPPVPARLELCLSGQGATACGPQQVLNITAQPGQNVDIGVAITARDNDAQAVNFEVRRDDTGELLSGQSLGTILKDQTAQVSFTIPVPAAMVAGYGISMMATPGGY